MKKFLGYILSPIATAAFFLMLVIFHPIQWLCLKLGGYSAHKRSVDILNFFLVQTVYILGNTVTFINKQNLPLSRPIIFVANHQSLFDIPPMIYHLRKYHAKFISKVELAKGTPSIS
ncbi:1-acyl-sn-glycerol-3-phosphate acyltransferase, partial [Mucilaginibacter sp. 5B2]|nr:1-acyl-sn-glycerol-3-phosphate acyltransferase [Mucilaginibacter sp. 5B2]